MINIVFRLMNCLKKEECSQKAESAVRHAIALRGAGWPGVCVCRASAGGNRSYPDLLERPQQRCWCWCPDVPSSSPAVPTAQLPRPRLSFLGRGEGTPLRLSFCSLQTKWGGEVVMFWFGVGDLGQN